MVWNLMLMGIKISEVRVLFRLRWGLIFLDFLSFLGGHPRVSWNAIVTSIAALNCGSTEKPGVHNIQMLLTSFFEQGILFLLQNGKLHESPIHNDRFYRDTASV